jgi:hypothetical protein
VLLKAISKILKGEYRKVFALFSCRYVYGEWIDKKGFKRGLTGVKKGLSR